MYWSSKLSDLSSCYTVKWNSGSASCEHLCYGSNGHILSQILRPNSGFQSGINTCTQIVNCDPTSSDLVFRRWGILQPWWLEHMLNTTVWYNKHNSQSSRDQTVPTCLLPWSFTAWLTDHCSHWQQRMNAELLDDEVLRWSLYSPTAFYLKTNLKCDFSCNFFLMCGSN